MQCKACGAEMVKGRLVSTYCSHFVLDDGTVEYGGKEVESFPVKHNGFWKGMVEGCYVVSYYCPACKVIVIPADRKSTRL